MRALITGIRGFVGRHMAAELRRRGWDVDGCDIAGDFGVDAMDEFRSNFITVPDLLVHCAYHVGGRKGIDGDSGALAKNLALDAAMFDAAVKWRVGRVLYFSSSAAYPVDLQKRGAEVLRETNLCLPTAADGDYGFAKAVGERLAWRARRQGVPVTVVRPFSGYGSDQSLDYPFPTFIKRAVEGADPFPIWGDDTQVRDWIHIDDVVNGALAVVDNGTTLPVNLCSGVGFSLRHLAELMWLAAGRSGRPNIEVQGDQPMGVHTRVGSAHRSMNVYPRRVMLHRGIARAIADYRLG